MDRSAMDREWRTPWVSESRNRASLSRMKMPAVKLLAQTPLRTEFGDWTYMVFGDYATGRIHTMMVYGRLGGRHVGKREGVLVRVHSSCATSEIFHATNCECREELHEAMRRIRRNGSGIVVYLDQEGAGNGLVGKVRAYAKTMGWKGGRIADRRTSVYRAYKALGYGSETRDFGSAAAMLKSIGVRSVKLMTNNPAKVAGMESEGIAAEMHEIHIRPKNRAMERHLRAKARELGHRIGKADMRVAR